MHLNQTCTLYYQLALSAINGVGNKTMRSLLEHYGSAQEVLNAPIKELTRFQNMGVIKAKHCKSPDIFKFAEEQLALLEKHQITALFINDEHYPQRLKNCADAPILLYKKGNAELNTPKQVAVVGTRNNDEYGTKICNDLIDGLQHLEDIVIVSGLASGIDTVVHKRCVKNSIPTIAVLGHGFNMIHPKDNKKLAGEMLHNGSLLTEHPFNAPVIASNFAVRNRIIAGLCDVTVVIQSSKTGGSMITAKLAFDYNREVACFPGRVNDSRSEGCNNLIARNIASLICGFDDLKHLMNWDVKPRTAGKTKQLSLHLTAEEQTIVTLLQKENLHIDELHYQSGIAQGILATLLLQLEMQNVIKSLPGKIFTLL